MPATAIEVSILRRESTADSALALERLAAIGPIVFLRGLRSDDYAVTASTSSPDLGRLAAALAAGEDREPAGGGRKADPRAVARLEALRAEYGADWLIASEGSVASARACPGWRIICLGPATDQFDPTRPDHRAHSLLEAARLIEAAAAFA